MDGEEASLINAQLRSRGLLRSRRTWVTISKRDTRHKFFVRRACDVHYTYRTRAAVASNPAALQCPVCNRDGTSITDRRGRARVVSPDEEWVWDELDERGVVWSLQDRVSDWAGAVDACVYFPLQQWLCIQVDGITHKGKPMSDRRDQLGKDALFDTSAVAAGFSVLRLDTRHNARTWATALDQALAHGSVRGRPPTVFTSQP